MRLPQIRTNSQFAQTELTIQKPVQSIEQPRAQLDIEQPKAELTMKTTPAQLSIDQTAAWEAMDLKHIFRRIEEFAQKGHQDFLEGIARRAQDGDQLMKIEHGGNALGAIAKSNGERQPKQLQLGWSPPHFSVKNNHQPRMLEINWEPKKVINNTKAQKPIVDYQPGEVTTDVKPRESLNIDFVNLKFKNMSFETEI
ncbi:DUF6470 family protein [Bacillus sp. FJAT-42315]|uniref:DUF6470 family protein n=1 Tax=Bacillus sp. FJAT-42315 TaxID=2014077 RepID=UPI000C243CD0|nr:DUF6470 family protein [Bacillus sp. FJAT-42315]